MSTEAETEVPQALAFRSQPLPGGPGPAGWLLEEEPSGVLGARLRKNQWQHGAVPCGTYKARLGDGGEGWGGEAEPGPSSHLALLGGRESGGAWAPGQSPSSRPKTEVGGLTPEGHLGPLPRPTLTWPLALRALPPLQLNCKPGNLQQGPKIHTIMMLLPSKPGWG